MRKSLWIIPVVLLFTALGSTSAHADATVTTGGYVTGIDGITIAGTTYNVTFGTTDDMTFSNSYDNAVTMADDIAQDLSNYSADTVSYDGITTITYLAVDGGETTVGCVGTPPCLPQPYTNGGGVWNEYNEQFEPDNNYSSYVSADPSRFAWTEFTIVTVTPEPGTASLMLIGLGSFVAMMVMRFPFQ